MKKRALAAGVSLATASYNCHAQTARHVKHDRKFPMETASAPCV